MQWIGFLYWLDFSPNSAMFKILILAGFLPKFCHVQNSWSFAQTRRSSQLQDSPAKLLGITRALVTGLYTWKGKGKIKGKEKILLYSFKTSIPLKTGFGLHRGILNCCCRQPWAWALEKSLKRPSFFLYFRERKNEATDLAVSQLRGSAIAIISAHVAGPHMWASAGPGPSSSSPKQCKYDCSV